MHSAINMLLKFTTLHWNHNLYRKIETEYIVRLEGDPLSISPLSSFSGSKQLTHQSHFRLSLALLSVCFPLFFHFWLPPGVRLSWISRTLRFLHFSGDRHHIQFQKKENLKLQGKHLVQDLFYSIIRHQ